jgi:hypothetical protein
VRDRLKHGPFAPKIGSGWSKNWFLSGMFFSCEIPGTKKSGVREGGLLSRNGENHNGSRVVERHSHSSCGTRCCLGSIERFENHADPQDVKMVGILTIDVGLTLILAGAILHYTGNACRSHK